MEIFPICRDLEILHDDVYWSYDMYILEMCDLYLLHSCLNFYACYILGNFWRSDVYFLNKCFIRVFYRLKNRALQDAHV